MRRAGERPRFFRRLALEGSLDAAEAYVDGDWDADSLTAALRIFTRNEAALAGLDAPDRLRLVVERVRHRLRGNDRARARRNVAAPYDLGNDFFRRTLDPTSTYSCGVWERPESTLEEASVAKLTTARFRRLWNLYLCWCEAGFLERYISVAQLVFARPRAR